MNQAKKPTLVFESIIDDPVQGVALELMLIICLLLMVTSQHSRRTCSLMPSFEMEAMLKKKEKGINVYNLLDLKSSYSTEATTKTYQVGYVTL